MEVYEQAVQGVTYYVDIWLHYCVFAISTYSDPDTIRSFKRIKTPVKGHSCKHNQLCFFCAIICSPAMILVQYVTSVSAMVKILREVGDNVVDVIILADE